MSHKQPWLRLGSHINIRCFVGGGWFGLKLECQPRSSSTANLKLSSKDCWRRQRQPWWRRLVPKWTQRVRRFAKASVLLLFLVTEIKISCLVNPLRFRYGQGPNFNQFFKLFTNSWVKAQCLKMWGWSSCQTVNPMRNAQFWLSLTSSSCRNIAPIVSSCTPWLSVLNRSTGITCAP